MEPVSDQRIYSNRYQVTHLIARGGMAMVYRAHDLLLNRAVALKILYPELSVDTNFVERFRREAQAAANLSHPNIVPVFDWGEEDGTYFIVMELIEGTSLAELLRDSRTLSPTKSAQVCAQVAAALSYAHRQNVVHRDVKPGNILLTSDGQVKVTDFGIAQAISTEDNLTVAGSVMGTATYFSPEQAEGAVVDGRSDVYSLGIVLYELLAGRPPFIGDTPVAVASKHVRETVPSPRQFNPSLPTDLEAITLLALAKDPGERYQTADEFRADLLRFTEGQPVMATGKRAVMGDDVTTAVAAVPAGERTSAIPIMPGPRTDVRRRRRWTPWLITGLILLALLAGGLAYAVISNNKTPTMPNVVGQDFNAALHTLANDGITNIHQGYQASTKPVGVVISTNPPYGGKVNSNTVVTLVTSTGEVVNVQLPDVTQKSLADAQTILQNLGFVTKLVYTTSGPQNVVLFQSPSGNTSQPKGSLVYLTIVNPTAPVQVPNVAGQTISAASAAIGAAQLTVTPTPTNECSNHVPQGLVIGTNPGANSSVQKATPVTLIVSTGVCNVYVPNVINSTQAAATAALQAQGFVPSYITADPSTCNPTTAGYVAAQDLPPGSAQPYGSTINLTYCAPNG